MAAFRHPSLVRGTVYTPYGAFRIVRGVVEMPEEIGALLGWRSADEEHASHLRQASTGDRDVPAAQRQ